MRYIILLVKKRTRRDPKRGARGERSRGETDEPAAAKGGAAMVFAIGPQLLDACVLAVLSRGDAYGYVLTQQVKSRLDISESTLYPVLRRLQRDGLLTVYDRPYQGRNRRYYAITGVGQTQLERRREEWRQFRDGVEQLLKEDEANG